MPAHQRRPAGGVTRRSRLLAGWLVAVALGLLVAVPTTSVVGKDWSPQIKVARSSQVYWESAMRAADREIRSIHRARQRARASLKRSRAGARVAAGRHREALGRLAGGRLELREARLELRPRQVDHQASSVAATPADEAPATPALERPWLVLPELVIAVQALEPTDAASGVVEAATGPGRSTTAKPDLDTQNASQRRIALLERRVERQRRHTRLTRRKVEAAQRAVGRAQQRLAVLRARERSAKARRESAERNLGSWVLAMERYAHVRAAKMAHRRAGLDTHLAWPARGHISQAYGPAHDGLDIASYRGSPIRAAAFGVVAFVGWNPWDERARAFMVVIAHAGSLETLYGHLLPRRVVRVGQPVKKGQLIGYMGSTGKSTGPHLHLEVRRGRATLDPLGFL